MSERVDGGAVPPFSTREMSRSGGARKRIRRGCLISMSMVLQHVAHGIRGKTELMSKNWVWHYWSIHVTAGSYVAFNLPNIERLTTAFCTIFAIAFVAYA